VRITACALLFCTVFWSTSACKTLVPHSELASQDFKQDFCSGKTSFIWDKAQVQGEIRKLLSISDYRDSGLGTYSEIYLRMTELRDKERCNPSSKMYPTSEFSKTINDRLADIMTKSYVAHQSMCFEQLQGHSVVLSLGAQRWCQWMSDSLLKKESSLAYATGSTALYLSHTMPLALSAIIHDRTLWQDSPSDSMEARLKAMAAYKHTYDAFNAFLASQLRLIVDVLAENNRISCPILKVAASAAERFPLAQSIFREIRDRSFQRGLELAKLWPLGKHPYVAAEVPYDVHNPYDDKTTPLIIDTEADFQFALSRLQNPYLKIFNGKDTPSYLATLGLSCSGKK